MRPRRSKRYHRKMLEAMEMLYGEKEYKPMEKVAKNFKQRAKECPSEHDEQVRVAAWLDRKGYLWAASANGGLRHRTVAIKLKASGVKAGHPDIILYEARGKYHGMLIEEKKQVGGVMSDQQKWWAQELNKRDYLCVRCNGFDETIKAIEEYMK